MSAPRAAAQLLRLPTSLGNSFRPLLYLFTVVGTARCAVRAAFSGASTCRGQRGARSVPPAARWRGRRSAPSLPFKVTFQGMPRSKTNQTRALIPVESSYYVLDLGDQPIAGVP